MREHRFVYWAGRIAVITVTLFLLAFVAEASAASPTISFCNGMPPKLKKWFEEHKAKIFYESKSAPSEILICFRRSRIVFNLFYDGVDVSQVEKKVMGGSSQWESDQFLYYPTTHKLVLYQKKPFVYIKGLFSAYWDADSDYPSQTVHNVMTTATSGDRLIVQSKSSAG